MIPYQILEVANCHGGDLSYLLSLINEFKHHKNFGIKFQPLHPDKIATNDFQWYNVYKELFFDLKEWKTIINKATETKEIWLDLFDDYGVDIFIDNKNNITGLKLQASILYNESIVNGLQKTGIEDKILILNISAIEIEEIKERLNYFSQRLQPKEIWIEVGFQAYPTEIKESAYVKICILKQHFSNKIVFADHVDGKTDDAIWLPIFAALNGANVIEKHIMHSTLETKYDHFSSINCSKYDIFYNKLTEYQAMLEQPFINQSEMLYLKNSQQMPIAKHNLKAGTLINKNVDIEFKRSGQPGLSTKEIFDLQQAKYILNGDISAQKTFKKENFKKAVIATIVACRMKSTRLEKKSLEKIGDISSVEKCLQSCLNIKDTHFTILATSDLEADKILKNYTYSPSVIFHTGDPEDVIRRYLGIIDKLGIDVIVRVTADMPYVSSEIVDYLMTKHFESGADYTVAKQSAVGSSAEIINTRSLKKIKDYFPNANYSEYMTWYFQNNPEHFKLNFVDLPENLVRDYRLTLDYKEDLDLFIEIQKHIDNSKKPQNIETIFEFLDNNKDVAKLNSHITLKYKTDTELINTLNRETKIN